MHDLYTNRHQSHQRYAADPTMVDHRVSKKPKVAYPCAPDSEWPKAWRMPETVKDQKLPNKLEPNIDVSPEQMRELGIEYWKMDAESYTYPIKSVPWDPKEATDPMLQELRDARGYSYGR